MECWPGKIRQVGAFADGVAMTSVANKKGAQAAPFTLTLLADQTLKLSPHPHVSFTFGLLNLKPSLKPSRAKSNSVPSR